VSRGAHKLLAALDAFPVDPRGVLALDAGASTGGFTQVLLERGARSVVAVDVGHDQLAPLLRDDSRVHNLEGINLRTAGPADISAASGINESPRLVTADLSFISLPLVIPSLASIVDPGGDLIV